MVVLEVIILGKTLNRLGEINTNKQGTKMKIIRYGGYTDIDVEFLDDFHYVKKNQAYINFKNGSVKNPYDRTLFGVGYIGVGEYKPSENKRPTKVYAAWTQMLNRCYNKNEAKNRPAYYGIATVCEEWQCFQNFAKWYFDNYYEVDGFLHVDKDILYPGNKEYNPHKCLLVPQRINMLFLNKPNQHNLPNGIRPMGNKYETQYNGEHIGYYYTLEEATKAHTDAKRKHIREVAEEYKEIIPVKVYGALMNW